MTTGDGERSPPGDHRSFMRRLVALHIGPTLAAHAEDKAREFSLERALDEAAAGGLGILHVTWRAPLWPTAAGNILHALAFLGAGLLYGLIMWHGGREIHTYHAGPQAYVRRAIARSRLTGIAHAVLFFCLLLSLAAAVLAGAFGAYCWFAGGGHARDARAVAPVALVAAGLFLACYGGIAWLGIVKLPSALRRLLPFPYRAASVTTARKTREANRVSSD